MLGPVRDGNITLSGAEDVTVFVGDNKTFQYTISDENGGPKNLTGWTIKMGAKSNLDDTSRQWLVSGVLGTPATNGIVTFAVLAAQFATAGHYIVEVWRDDSGVKETLDQFSLAVLKSMK